MIIKKSDRFVVTDTITKEVISEHPFTDDKKSIKEADKAARESNELWKSQQ